MKPTLTRLGGLFNKEVSPSLSTRTARRIDTTTFEVNKHNKQIFLGIFPMSLNGRK